MEVDTTFDCRRDADGKDPDGNSSTLRRYHRLLWSKRLPDGTLLDLSDRVPGVYLHHKSRRGKFFLSSDTVVPTFRKNPRIIAMLEDVGETPVNAFGGLGYMIGGMMLFPANRIGGNQTINQRRGCHPRIKDRFDLTLECIRCHYCEKYSPLAETLARYSSFGSIKEFVGRSKVV